MTQNGSFPDRPRGRRARHGDDGPDWQGRDVVPEDGREFPDLEPIRGRRLSDADNRGLPGDVGPSGGRGRHSSSRDGAGEQGAPPWAGQQAPYNQQSAQYDQRGQYGAQQYGQDQYGRPGQQAYDGGRPSRHADEQYPDQQYQGPAVRRPAPWPAAVRRTPGPASPGAAQSAAGSAGSAGAVTPGASQSHGEPDAGLVVGRARRRGHRRSDGGVLAAVAPAR